MRFKINEINAGSLKEYLLATLKRQNKYHELEALQHITFDIRKGEVVGIIGTNGSGKSTLLKLIAGVLKPSEGNIEVDRKKVQLLTLGTGFDSELTARENVYLNGAIIGYSREFIDENYDKIVEFAELDGFMDEKIKNFSNYVGKHFKIFNKTIIPIYHCSPVNPKSYVGNVEIFKAIKKAIKF